MSKRDYYQTLGVNRDDDINTIKKAYRGLAMKFHPDRNPNNPKAEEKFKEVNEAWGILGDENKRKAYDQFGHNAFQNGGDGFNHQNFSGANFSDIFDSFFNQNTHQGRQAQPGNDLRYQVTLSLEEAFSGKEINIRIVTAITCTSCDGSGAKAGSSSTTCASCGGRGNVRMQQGFFTVEQTCRDCGGEGRKIKNPCSSCRGTGRTNGKKNLSAKIPKGVNSGTRIRISGEGEAGMRGAPSGDLYIFVAVKPHTLFTRKDDDIYLKLPIPLTVACLGGMLEVPTIDGGRVEINIPEGTQTGTKFRVRGRGMSVLQTTRRGNMYVDVKPEIPKNLTKQQKDLLGQFKDSLHKKNTPDSESILQKIKHFWNSL